MNECGACILMLSAVRPTIPHVRIDREIPPVITNDLGLLAARFVHSCSANAGIVQDARATPAQRCDRAQGPIA